MKQLYSKLERSNYHMDRIENASVQNLARHFLEPELCSRVSRTQAFCKAYQSVTLMLGGINDAAEK
jgi:hypothetical protein